MANPTISLRSKVKYDYEMGHLYIAAHIEEFVRTPAQGTSSYVVAAFDPKLNDPGTVFFFFGVVSFMTGPTCVMRTIVNLYIYIYIYFLQNNLANNDILSHTCSLQRRLP